MSQHIFTFLRQFVLSRALKALPLKRARLVTPEPQRAPAMPETDTWLFAEPAPVEVSVNALAGQMTCLSATLGNLHALVSQISGEAPQQVSAEPAPVFGRAWSDAFLFDGEPHCTPANVHGALAEDSFLFDGNDEAEQTYIDKGLNLAMIADSARTPLPAHPNL